MATQEYKPTKIKITHQKDKNHRIKNKKKNNVIQNTLVEVEKEFESVENPVVLIHYYR